MGYKTISGSACAEFEINKSRFLSFAKRVNSEAEAAAFIQKIKKQHWEARHNCSAYIIGENTAWQKADDDGEPSGTAGKPILEVLKKQDLTDIVIVVTRYFGGIKLGAGGLIRAYGKAASLALDAALIVEKAPYRRLLVRIDYALLGTLENNLRQKGYIIEDKAFDAKVALTLLGKQGEEEIVITDVTNWTAANCAIEKKETIYLEIPLKK